MSKVDFPLVSPPHPLSRLQVNAGMSVCSSDDLHMVLLVARPGPAGTIDPSNRLSVMRDMEERVELVPTPPGPANYLGSWQGKELLY